MRISLFLYSLLFSFLPSFLFAQSSYYQQLVSYDMTIDVDVEKFIYNGEQAILYKNNSSDTLKKFYLHLYWNAFQPNSAMSQRAEQLGKKGDGRILSNGTNPINNLTEKQIGKQEIEFIKQNGKNLDFTIRGTILEVKLDKPILPNSSTEFQMKWTAKIPDLIRRGGKNSKETVALSMTQWYPKVCAYDYDGWHTNEYLGREFFAPFASFDVTISIDKNFVIGGSGVLQNADEIGNGYSPSQTQKPLKNKLTWRFKAENIHDFAWAADPNFVVEKEQLSNGTSLFYVHKNSKSIQENWDKAKPFVAKFFEIMESNIGKYPYSQYSIVQGGDGGMEYGMCTLILGESKSLRGLLGLIVHEATHSWFQHVLATNESEKAWLDEGFTSFVESFVMNQLMPNEKLPNPYINSIDDYLSIAGTEEEEPMNLIADHFNSSRAYGVAAYSKGETYLAQLTYMIGEKMLLDCLKEYYQTWKFKHPSQRDFEHIVQKKSGMYLRWFFNYFTETTYTIDYQIKSVIEKNNKTHIILRNNGKIPMPIELYVIDKNKNTEIHYVPLEMMRSEKTPEYAVPFILHEDWQWTTPEYELIIDKPKSEIKTIVIDATQRLADKNYSDNIYNN